MCRFCWEEDGKHAIDNERVRACANAIAGVYDCSGVGGRLHVAVDDWNMDDETLAFCQSEVDGATEDDGQLDAERYCLTLLKALTFEERCSALALHDGFWS